MAFRIIARGVKKDGKVGIHRIFLSDSKSESSPAVERLKKALLAEFPGSTVEVEYYKKIKERF